MNSDNPITRRAFAGLATLGAVAPSVRAAGINETLGTIRQRGIPAVAAVVAGPNHVHYRGAFGNRDSQSQVPVTTRSIFSIASMTKAVTATAAMQLVERGKLNLQDPVAKYLPELNNLLVLDGFSLDGLPVLRLPASPVLLRHLLTHTSGFAYQLWNPLMSRFSAYLAHVHQPEPRVPPLAFDPGTRWGYGTGMDWVGRIIEAVTGHSLEAYFQREIFQPLGMYDTSSILPAAKFPRLVSWYQRENDGRLKESPRKMTSLAIPKDFAGGDGLYSTPEDYVLFMQMILRRGRGPANRQILRADTVDLMTTNQIGNLSAGKLKTVYARSSSDMDMHPGHTDGFGYGFLINSEGYEGGRAAGSLTWAGIANTYFWIDPKSKLCAAICMQYFPFFDKQAAGLLRDFERAVYSTTNWRLEIS